MSSYDAGDCVRLVESRRPIAAPGMEGTVVYAIPYFGLTEVGVRWDNGQGEVVDVDLENPATTIELVRKRNGRRP